MKISLLELRKQPGRILAALENNERVILSCRGREVGEITSVQGTQRTRMAQEHEAFGMWADREDGTDVAAHVRSLRKGSYDAL